MRIIWDSAKNIFIAEFSSDFWGDLNAVKAAGFRTTGDPDWIWYTSKVKVLDYLRNHKPNSGLTASEEAFEKYNLLKRQSEKKREFNEIFKREKKQINETPPEKTYFDPELGMVTCIDVKPKIQNYTPRFVRPPSPKEKCSVCGEPIYFYEYPDFCLWCKKSLDIKNNM
jgi:hypothetical protein